MVPGDKEGAGEQALRLKARLAICTSRWPTTIYMTRVIFDLQTPLSLPTAAVAPGHSAILMEDGSNASELFGEGLLASSGELQIYYRAPTLTPHG